MPFNFQAVLGPLLVATWANSVLYTVEVIQAAYYYRHFKHDNWMLKLLVLSTIAIDSASMITNYASVYLYTITHWGGIWLIRRGSIGQPVPLYIFTTGVVAASVQSFLVARYWLLTKNKFITLILCFFITVAASGTFASGVMIAIFPKIENRAKVMIPGTIWLIAAAVTDISIALALLLEFRKVKASFKETRSLIDGLMAQTIRTGASGATIELVILVAFLANLKSNGELLDLPLRTWLTHPTVAIGIAYCLGRVYCLTMLANLNARKPGNTESSKRLSLSTNLGIRGERGSQGRSEGGNDYGGIHVHRMAVVHIDCPQEFSMASFKTNPGQGLPDDSPASEIEMTVNDSAGSSSKKQDPFAA
ncbi:hypothetical protein B0H13DRAFT_2309003 [Mycena leptocephala]|nr:hypothetical protein B0H13DRAFT_2309003 [Mycena leptocephala]